MAFISDSVGLGGNNSTSDVVVIQWMLIRAQKFYSSDLFNNANYNLRESGIVDEPTSSAIKAIIAYRKRKNGYFSVVPPPPPMMLSTGAMTFPDSIISPDDDNYKLLLRCSLYPICENTDREKVDFYTDPLATQALSGKINFQGFKVLAENKDGDVCGDADGNYCGVNPVTGTPGINAVASGIQGELRPGVGGGGGYKARRSGGREHEGIDISGTVGDSVYATLGGKVTLNKGGGYGNMVMIDHGNGYQSRYAHLTSFNVKNNQEVKGDDVIGKLGQTGNANGQPASEAHVHFEVRKNGTKTNPVTFLNSACPVKFK